MKPNNTLTTSTSSNTLSGYISTIGDGYNSGSWTIASPLNDWQQLYPNTVTLNDDWVNQLLKITKTDSNKSEKKKYTFPKPKLIKTIGKKTFVTWEDGTFTKVVCEKDQNPDPFAAFCIAFTKKLLGTTDNIVKTIEAVDEEEIRKREKEANRKANEKKRELERKKFEQDVERKRYELAVARAAEKKLNKQKEAKE